MILKPHTTAAHTHTHTYAHLLPLHSYEVTNIPWGVVSGEAMYPPPQSERTRQTAKRVTFFYRASASNFYPHTWTSATVS